MLKGKQKLYNKLVPEKKPTAGKQNVRDAGLDNMRDKMAHRFYFHSYICRKRYDDCINELYNEFDKQADTVIKHLMLRTDLINELKNKNTTTAMLKKKYPFYNWCAKLI